MATITDETYQPLWKDRKRILGMPLSFTKYEISKERLIMHKGLFRTETDELLLYRIMDIKLVRTFSQKLFGVGSIILYCADRSNSELEIKNIKKPDAVRRFLSKIVEQERTSKGLTGRELYGVGGSVGGSGCTHEFADTDGDGIPD